MWWCAVYYHVFHEINSDWIPNFQPSHGTEIDLFLAWAHRLHFGIAPSAAADISRETTILVVPLTIPTPPQPGPNHWALLTLVPTRWLPECGSHSERLSTVLCHLILDGVGGCVTVSHQQPPTKNAVVVRVLACTSRACAMRSAWAEQQAQHRWGPLTSASGCL